MLPAERRHVAEQVIRDVRTLVAQVLDGSLQVNAVPMNDCSR